MSISTTNRPRVSIDTSYTAGIFVGKGAALEPDPEFQFCVPAPVLGELYYGALKSRNPEHGVRQVELFLEHCEILPVTEAVARRFGEVKAELASRGAMIPDNDIWIAATALESNLPLATRDAHFDSSRTTLVTGVLQQ